jgi:hypothetical protein
LFVQKFKWLPIYIDAYDRERSHAAIPQMLLWIKLAKKYKPVFLKRFFLLLADKPAYSEFQESLKTMTCSPFFLDLLDCGYGLSFNTMIPDEDFLPSIRTWLSLPK